MRAMLSLTICGGLAAPWARTDGACAASARATAVENAEAANRRWFMVQAFLYISNRDFGRFDPGIGRLQAVRKNSFLPAEPRVVYERRQETCSKTCSRSHYKTHR